jgi:hypothetical protein
MQMKSVKEKDPSKVELWNRCDFMDKLKADKRYRKGLHIARTLDQAYYYDSTNESVGREDDQQVITRYMAQKFGRDSKDKSTKDVEIPILVVKQLWLWKVNEST